MRRVAVDASADRLAMVVRALPTFPGVQPVDECSWERVLDRPDRLSGLADAMIVSATTAKRGR